MTETKAQTRDKAIAVGKLSEALTAYKKVGMRPEGLAAFITDTFSSDPRFLETLSNILGRNAHSLERDNRL